MENYNIENLLKASNVKRWHTVDCVKTQSLSEHQWNVTIICIHIAESIGLEDRDMSHLVMRGLTHDIEEIWTGDMPSPYKESLKRTGAPALDEQWGIGTPVPTPSHPYDDGHPVEPEIPHNGEIGGIIRAADLIDAWWWSSKYVLDESVKADCWRRLYTFRCNQTNDLKKAIDQIVAELE